jgi:hypothetical protein
MEEMGFDLISIFGCYFLFNEGDISWRGVGFMIQERRDLEEQLSCSFVSPRACIVCISAIRDS